MHLLEWSRDGYFITPKSGVNIGKPDQHERLRTASEPTPTSREKAAGVPMEIWEEFVTKGAVNPEAVHWRILESWQRCRDLDVDPTPRKCWDILSTRELEPHCSTLRRLSHDPLDTLYTRIKGRGLLITVSDGKGYLVHTCGDLETLLQADKLNFGPGANWSEQSVGTNAIGTALATGHPLKVMGREHFCQSHHAWTCAAAPIYDPGGNIIGCIDISGPLDSNHESTLSLAVNTVKKIENALYKAQSSEIINQSNALLSTVFNSVLTGLLSVDRRGMIRHANPAACALLEQPEDALVGRGAEELFSFHRFMNLLSTSPEQGHTQGVPLQCRFNASFLARAHPVSGSGGKLNGAVITILEKQRPYARPPVLPAKNGPRFTLDRILGQSEPMVDAVHKAHMAAQSPSTVLLTGESGTGKEMFAQGIHNAGPRASGPFSALNCGALSGELIQSELFGYVDGAFTGARRGGKPGRFEAAAGGTLFLDEIGEMPIAMQVNLLRVLEERKVVRIGGTKPVPVDVRIIAATNRNLADEVEKGTFRRDLYYRLKVVTIFIPPLRKREGDVPLLARKLIPDIAGRVGKTVTAIHPDVQVCLKAHSWPGNVRELINALEYAVNIMPTTELLPEHLPDEISEYLHDEKGTPPDFSLESMEAETIRKALAFHEGNITSVARALGIGRNTLYSKMKRYGIV